MIKFFRKIRQQLLSENKFSKYLLYALGEVVLVVIGIFIALQLNNANESRKSKIQLNENLKTLYSDIENDLQDITRVKNHYAKLKPYYAGIITNTITKEEFLNYKRISNLLTFSSSWTIEKKGVELISNKNVKNDTMLNNVVFSYNNYSTEIDGNALKLSANANENIEFYRDNFDWFALWLNDFRPDMFHKIVNESLYNNQEFRNRIAFRYIIIYNNYLVDSDNFESELKKFQKQLKTRLKE